MVFGAAKTDDHGVSNLAATGGSIRRPSEPLSSSSESLLAASLIGPPLFDPQLPNANGSNPELKLRSASSQNLHWRTAAATIKSALVRVS
jgi:hypothetical protein